MRESGIPWTTLRTVRNVDDSVLSLHTGSWDSGFVERHVDASLELSEPAAWDGFGVKETTVRPSIDNLGHLATPPIPLCAQCSRRF